MCVCVCVCVRERETVCVCVSVVCENEDGRVWYRAVKLKTKASGLAECKLGLLEVREVRRDKGVLELAEDCTFV